MLAVIDLTRMLPWFASAVRYIRMLRIEEINDLVPVVQQVAELSGGAASGQAFRRRGITIISGSPWRTDL